MTLQEGDVLRFDYTLYIEGQEKPLDTSLEAVARKQGIHHDEKQYQPLTVVLGRKQVIPGLEKHLLGLKDAKKATTVTIPAKEAYGDRDPAKVKDVPMAQFRKQKIQPQVGLELNFQGQRAVVTRVAGGRVRVDMNHDLAGKDLKYDVKPVALLTDREEKINAVLDNLFPFGGYNLVLGDTVDLEIPDQAKFDQQWPMHKFRVLTDLRAVAGFDATIRIIENYPGDAGQHDHAGHDHAGHDHGEEE